MFITYFKTVKWVFIFMELNQTIIINRIWEMPCKWTFKMRAIQSLFKKYKVGSGWIDPFPGRLSPAAFKNEKEDGLEFLKAQSYNFFDGCLFDPPYSVEMCLRKYKPKWGGTAGRDEYHQKCKKEIARILKPGGITISFGWNSGGIGKKNGFNIIEILLIYHGSAGVCRHDTIVTIDKRTDKVQRVLL